MNQFAIVCLSLTPTGLELLGVTPHHSDSADPAVALREHVDYLDACAGDGPSTLTQDPADLSWRVSQDDSLRLYIQPGSVG